MQVWLIGFTIINTFIMSIQKLKSEKKKVANVNAIKGGCTNKYTGLKNPFCGKRH